MSFTSLRTAIMTKLGTITQLAFVDDKHHTDITGYPAATFEPVKLENEFYTSSDNKRLYQFTILVHQEMDTIGRDEAIRILDATVDAIKSAFDTDYTLGGVVDYMDPITVDFGEYEEGNASVKVAIIRVAGTAEEQVTT
jgi:hypothetical protein